MTTKKRGAAKSARLKIPDEAIVRSRGRGRINPFKLAAHPPSAVPSGIAQDSAIGQVYAWAGGGALSEGLEFLGYPYLAELAQRPEYRRLSETIARHMTRRWIKLKAKGNEDKSEKIARLEDAMNRLGVQDCFRRVAEQDGFFGRGHLFIDFGNSDDRNELRMPIGDGQNEISKQKVGQGSLRRLKPVEAVWTYPSSYNANDPLKPDWYKPQTWFVMGKEIHASRLLTFIGREVPDLLKPAYSFGGLSLSQMAKPYVDNWLRTRQSVADIVSAFSVMVLKTRLVDALNAGGSGDDLFRRAELFNNLRDNRGLMIVDKDGEDFSNVSAPLSGLEMLQAQTQEHMAAVSGIPIVELLGIQPAGLNASSEGEIRTFFDWIHSSQEVLFRPNLTRLIGFIQLSEFGQVEPDITFDFEPLWSLDEKELAETESVKAGTDSVLVDIGAITAQDVRKRLAADESSAYAGLDLEEEIAIPEIDIDPQHVANDPNQPPTEPPRLRA